MNKNPSSMRNRMALAIAMGVALISTGCATRAPEALICTESEQRAIGLENERLVEQKKRLDAWAAGAPIPQEHLSLVKRDVLLASYQKSYNKQLDLLIYRSKDFNERCAGKPPRS